MKRTWRLLACLALLPAGALGQAATPLFPEPLHIVRRVTDALSQRSIRVDEYCAGNRIVSIRGTRVAILDFAEESVTEIDRGAATYSVTPFADLAQSNATLAKTRPVAASGGWKMTAASTFIDAAADQTAMAARLEISIDASIALTRASIEALIGASHPALRTIEHDAVLKAAGSTRARAAPAETRVTYGLPRVQKLSVAGEVIFSNVVESVDGARVPPELLRVDASLQRVERAGIRLARDLDSLDRLPGQR